MMIWTLAFRNIFRHKTRTIITLASIIFGCIAIIFVGGFFDNGLTQLRDGYIKGLTGHIQIMKKGGFEKGGTRPLDYLLENPQEIVDLVSSVPAVRAVNSRILFSGLLSNNETSVSFIGQGIEPDKELTFIAPGGNVWTDSALTKKINSNPDLGGAIIEAGDALDNADPYSIIIGKGLAQSSDIQPGDSVVLLTNTVSGSINALDMRVRGIFSTSMSSFDDYALRLPLTTARQLLRTEGTHSIVIRLHKTEDTEQAKAAIKQLLGPRNNDLDVRSWREINDFYTKTESLFNQQFFIIKLVIAIVTLLSIFSTMNMAVLERTSEIGTIMAMGTKRTAVVFLFLWEGFFVGLMGGVLGLIFGYIVTSIIAVIGIPMPPAPGVSFNWTSQPNAPASTYIFVFFLALISSVISSIHPAWRASRLEIATALRHVS